MSEMRYTVVAFCWILVVAAGAWLRFENLSARPFHADEATGARITAQRMEKGGSAFDPTHYHGPLLGSLAIPLCSARGETNWRSLTKGTLRLVPAIAGTLLVCLPLWWRRRCGDAPMLLAAALLATSPLLVYYSRMFIHEMLLTLFGLAALLALTRNSKLAIPGFLIGLMYATKETFAISIIAWTGAGCLVAWEHRHLLDRETLLRHLRDWWLPVLLSVTACAITAAYFYTDAFRRPQGAIDAIRTFFVYDTVEGHDKPAGYYLRMLAVPVKSAGLWWFNTPLLVLAFIAYAGTFRRHPETAKHRPLIRFLTYSTAAHFLIYSLIAYKTPWLACLPWAHLCLLAGFAAVTIPCPRKWINAAILLLTTFTLLTQFRQTRWANGRFAADERNPYAYVPTRKDIELMQDWLTRLQVTLPPGSLDTVAVVGSDYWPLPWYLRQFDRIGYWSQPPENLNSFPLVFALPDALDRTRQTLAESHTALPRGLRPEVPLHLFLRKDLWNQWMNSKSR